MKLIKMTSARPLYVSGAVVTEFETTESHARLLEASGYAIRAGEVDAASGQADDSVFGPSADAQVKPVLTSAKVAAKKAAPKKRG